jgi:hypothetical protein
MEIEALSQETAAAYARTTAVLAIFQLAIFATLFLVLSPA